MLATQIVDDNLKLYFCYLADVYNAVTFAHFHIFGKVRVSIDMFNKLVTEGAIDRIGSLTSRALILSKPIALFRFIDRN